MRGYGILQPRVGVSLPSAQPLDLRRDPLGPSRAWTPTPPRSPTCTRTSTARAASPARASTTSTAFERATHGRFPENTLLSHDLIEGNYARAGLATDVIVYDDYPTRYLTFTRRKHRWIRGDWQLLPLAHARGAGPRRRRSRNRLSLLSRWKILDNLRRSTVEIAQLAFLVGRLDAAARLAAPLDPARPRRDRGALDRVAAARGAAAAARQVVARLLRARSAATRPPACSSSALAVVVPSASGVGLGRRDRAHALAAAGVPTATCSSGRRRRRPSAAWPARPRVVWRGMWPAVALAGAIAGRGRRLAAAGRTRDRRATRGELARRGAAAHRSLWLAVARHRPRARRARRAPRAAAAAATAGARRSATRCCTGASSTASSPPRPTGSRPTTSRKTPSRSWRCAPRPPTSASSCWRR